MDNKFLVVVTVLIVGFFGFLIFTGDDSSENTSNSEPTTHIQGAAEEATVTLVEYGDFECSACAVYYPVIEELKDQYGEDLAFQFRHFPLVSIHANAMVAHRASEAAANQGKFFEMYNLLYQNQSAWESRVTQNPAQLFENYAQQIGLDMDQYREDIASAAVNDRIQADIAAGNQLNVTATPTFLLNGEVIDSPDPTVEAFSEVIDAAIAENE